MKLAATHLIQAWDYSFIARVRNSFAIPLHR
jgi:hypothetical protein